MRIQVVGAGSFGLALARLLSMNGHEVRLWCRAEDDPETLRKTRQSRFFLPGVELPPAVEVVTNTDSDCEMAVLAVPSHAMREVAAAHRFPPSALRVSVAKGIENGTLLRMDEVIRDASGPCRVVALSGPSHAEEVARDLPALVVAAAESLEDCESVQDAFSGRTFRVYTSMDIVGVELGGSLKNVIAIAAGVCDGLGLGDNARSALMTRGLAEISRLGVVMGANPLTFAGLSGMGDLIATCSSRHSRNRAVGEGIAQGKAPEEILGPSHMVAEGVLTAKSARDLARKYDVEMPISEKVYEVLFEGLDPRAAITELMLRETKPERY